MLLLSRALARLQDPSKPLPADYVPCYDPGTLELLGNGKAHVDTPAEARAPHAPPGFAPSRRIAADAPRDSA